MDAIPSANLRQQKLEQQRLRIEQKQRQKRERTKEMREALYGGIAPTGFTVFGDDLLDAAEVKRVRREQEAENTLFANMIAKTHEKNAKKSCRRRP